MNIVTRVRHLFKRNRNDSRISHSVAASPDLSILDQYVRSAPSPQNALDIFRGEWSSQLPVPFSTLQAGRIELFEDARVRWFAEVMGGVRGKSILELGPLEAGHSYMLEALGASSIVAVESSTRAFLKCLIVKELVGLRRVRFLFGDFLEYLRADGQNFDVCLASGVLYHMQNPAELVALLSRRCRQHVCVWTHHYDHAIVSSTPRLAQKFTGASSHEYCGFRHTLYRQEYQAALEWAGFCGSGAPATHWMTREDLFRCLHHFGFEVAGVAFEQPDHPNGPALAIVARRIG